MNELSPKKMAILSFLDCCYFWNGLAGLVSAGVAQLVEQNTCKVQVGGSKPLAGISERYLSG